MVPAMRCLAAILLLSSSRVAPSTPSGVGRCCGTGEVLGTSRGNVSCVAAPGDAPELEETDSGGSPGLPRCGTRESLVGVPIDHVASGDIPGPACLDVLYEPEDRSYLTVVYCRPAGDDEGNYSERAAISAPTALDVRRCCPRGEVFDVSRRACVFTTEEVSTVALLARLGSVDYIAVRRGAPKCPHAVVDYEIDATDFFLRGDASGQIMALSANGAVNLSASEESACLDAGSSEKLLAVRACRGAEFCGSHACVRKCCADDEAMLVKRCARLPKDLTLKRLHEELWDVPRRMSRLSNSTLDGTDYGVLYGATCKYGKYALRPDEEWHVTPQGYIHVPRYKSYEHHEYCVDMYYNTSLGTEDGLYPFVCFDDPAPEEISPIRCEVNATLELTSCAFLLITLLVYICLPTLQNLHGKTLMCHVASLFMAYVFLAMVAITSPREDEWDPSRENERMIICKFLAYAMLFCLLSAFSWLNVMCFDIWWTFGGLRAPGGGTSKSRGHAKRFLYYCLYAWGLALGVTCLGVAADHTKSLPDFLLPNIGLERCWFANGPFDYGEIVFFMFPVSVQLIANVTFFVLTSLSCSKVKADIRRVMAPASDPRSRRFQADRTKFVMNAKLFVVMGIPWVLEVVSYVMNHYIIDFQWKEEFFYVADVVNCLQGLLIFVLFVLKKKVYRALRKRLGVGAGSRANQAGVHDPYKVRKSASSSTLMSTFAVSTSP